MSFSYHMQWYVVTELSSVYEESPEGTKITSYCFMQILISVALPPSWRRKIFELFSNNLYWFLEQFYSNIIHKLNSLIKTQFNSIFFSIFTEWCKHHFYLILECFCHPYKKTLIFFFLRSKGISEAPSICTLSAGLALVATQFFSVFLLLLYMCRSLLLFSSVLPMPLCVCLSEGMWVAVGRVPRCLLAQVLGWRRAEATGLTALGSCWFPDRLMGLLWQKILSL